MLSELPPQADTPGIGKRVAEKRQTGDEVKRL
jgi:hypothetical protein